MYNKISSDPIYEIPIRRVFADHFRNNILYVTEIIFYYRTTMKLNFYNNLRIDSPTLVTELNHVFQKIVTTYM